MDQEIITQDGEIIDALGNTSSMAVQLQKAEVDQLITTARAYPRSLKQVQTRIMSLATLDEESAEECMYALPRGGKPIKGPSIRFAEILKQSFGNCRAAARVVAVDRNEMYVEAEGVFHDLETNSSTTARVRRRISDKRGKVFNDDMIIVTGNAACSIAMRNAILAGVPKPLWRRAYETVQATITGDVTTLTVNREKALKALAAFGVKPEQIFAALGREGIEEITVDDIGTLRGMYSALKNGEATVEEMFFGTVKAASQHEKVADPLSDEPVKPAAEEPAAESEAETVETTNTESDDAASSSAQSSAADELPSSSATEGDGAAVSPSGAPSPSSNLTAEDRRDLMECCAKLMFIAVDPDLATPNSKRGVLETSKNAWKAKLRPELHEHLKSFFLSADAVIKGEADRAAAISEFAFLLQCAPEEIGGE